MTPSLARSIEIPTPLQGSSASAVAERTLGVAVRFLWGERILDEQYLPPGAARALRIGSAPGCDFVTGDVERGRGTFELVRVETDGVVVRLPAQGHGSLLRPGEERPVPVAELRAAGLTCLDGDAHALTLSAGDLARVDLGPLTAEVQLRPPARTTSASLDERVDFAVLNTTLAFVFVAALFVVTALNEASATVGDDDVSSDARARLVKYFVAPPPSAPRPARPTFCTLGRRLEGASAASTPGGPASGPARVRPPRTRAGVDVGSALAAVFGPRLGAAPGGLNHGALSGQLQVAMSQLVASAGGADGLGASPLSGSRGPGDGARGGDGFMRLGPPGGVRSRVGAPGYGVVPSLVPAQPQVQIVVDPLPTEIEGSMDRELVRRVIQAHRGQLRACYESQLLRAQSLSGKVSVRFVIASTGAVTDAAVASSTVGSGELERCVVARVHSWTFPKPKGGGQVVVTYPFVFQQSGR